MTADYYVSLMKVYSRFVLNMNPSQRDKNQMLKIAVGPGTPDTEWTEAVMKTWKKHTWAWDISGVSLHWYTVPNGWPPSIASQKFRLDDYVKTLKSTLFMDEFLRKQEAVMDKYDPEKKVTLAVDEWSAWHAPLPGSNPAFLVQQNSIRDAVLASVRAKYEHYQEYLKRIPALRGKPVPIAIDEWAYFGGDRDSYKVVPAYAWAFHEMFRHSNVFQMGAFTFATAMMSENRTEAILNPTGMLFKMYRDHFGTIPVEVKGNSPQPKPTFPAGGDQPAVNPGSDTYPLDVNAALSEDRKTLAIAVLNPSDSEQSIRIAINGAKLASAGKLWRMAPDSIDATVQIDKKPEVQLEEQSLGAFPENITLRPFSVNIYSYQVQLSRSFERGSNETNETVLCLRNRHAHCAGIATHRPGAN
jgi:alpha-L-arabinofuranosidase